MASEKIDALELDISAKLTTENLDKLITALGKLSKALDQVNGKRVKEEIDKTGDSAKDASAKVNTLSNSYLTQAVRITALIAVYRKLIDVIGDGVSESMKYTENLNMFTVSLGHYAENAQKYAETVSDVMGIDYSEWERTQGVFNTLIEGFGVSGDKAAYMSQNLTQLTYDLASFYNLSFSEAEKKIQSAVAGELEPVRRLGYDLSQAKLTAIAQNPENYGRTTFAINEETGAIEANTEALGDNIERQIANFNELTQGEKVQLRYIALMTQVTDVQGDMAKTLRDPSNMMRVFREQTTMTSRALGNIFIPMLNQVLPYLTAFFQVLEDGLQEIAAFFGYEMPDMSDRMNVSDDVPYYENIVEATGSAAKNAKKIKDYMIGIDELNVLRPDEPTTGGSGSTPDYGSLATDLYTPGYDFLSKAIENSIANAKKQLEDFADYLNSLGTLGSIGFFAWEGAGTIGEGFLEWLIGRTPEELAQDAVDLYGGSIGNALWNALVNYSPAGQAGFDFWQWLVGKTPEELAQDADKSGKTIGEEFFSSFMLNSPWVTHAASMQSAWEVIFGLDSTVEQRAKESGHTLGEQFVGEFARTLLDIVTSNPVLQWFYETSTGRSAVDDLYDIQKKLGNDSGGRTQSRYQTKPTAGTEGTELRLKPVTTSPKLGNTSADEARKRGEATIKSYAHGMESALSDVEKTAKNIFDSALNGVDNNGLGASKFFDISSAEVKRYADGIRGGKSAVGIAGKDLYSSGYNGASNNGLGGSAFYGIASNLTDNFISGISNGNSNASKAGKALFDSSYSGASNNGLGADEFNNLAKAMTDLFAKGLSSGATNAAKAGATIYTNAYSATNNYGSGASGFGTIANSLAKMFSKTLGSESNTDDAYDSGAELSRHGALGSWAYEDDYYDAGSDSAEGFLLGIKEWADEARSAGETMGKLTLDALADAIKQGSPSKETKESGKWFALGYAKGIEEYASKATEAAEIMAKASVRAADTGFVSDMSVSVPKSYVGYGIGAMNEGAMATLASNIYQAVVSGMATADLGRGDTKVIIDGREIFRVVQSEERKNGAKISNGAFSR